MRIYNFQNKNNLTPIEKDLELANLLKEKYLLEKKVEIINCDILDFKLEETLKEILNNRKFTL